MTPQELGYTNSPWGDSNELREHIKRLNKQEAVEIELSPKGIRALRKIQQLRKERKYIKQENKKWTLEEQA